LRRAERRAMDDHRGRMVRKGKAEGGKWSGDGLAFKYAHEML
jgi:hypothetical protein